LNLIYKGGLSKSKNQSQALALRPLLKFIDKIITQIITQIVNKTKQKIKQPWGPSQRASSLYLIVLVIKGCFVRFLNNLAALAINSILSSSKKQTTGQPNNLPSFSKRARLAGLVPVSKRDDVDCPVANTGDCSEMTLITGIQVIK
jgi:hypothetical protein